MPSPLEIEVRDNDVEKAFKNLKKKMALEGIFKELKRRRYYEKPSEEKKRVMEFRRSDMLRLHPGNSLPCWISDKRTVGMSPVLSLRDESLVLWRICTPQSRCRAY